MPEATPAFPGQYLYTLSPTPSSQFGDGDYLVTFLDTSTGWVVDSAVIAMFGGDDATPAPNAVSLTSDDIAALAAAIGSGTTVGLTSPAIQAIASQILDTEQAGGGSVRGAIRAAASAGAGTITQPADGSTSTVTDWNSPTVRITSTNSQTGRVVTVNP